MQDVVASHRTCVITSTSKQDKCVITIVGSCILAIICQALVPFPAGCAVAERGAEQQRLLRGRCAGLDPVCPDGHLLPDPRGRCASTVAGGQAGEVQVLQGHHGCESSATRCRGRSSCFSPCGLLLFASYPPLLFRPKAVLQMGTSVSSFLSLHWSCLCWWCKCAS